MVYKVNDLKVIKLRDHLKLDSRFLDGLAHKNKAEVKFLVKPFIELQFIMNSLGCEH